MLIKKAKIAACKAQLSGAYCLNTSLEKYERGKAIRTTISSTVTITRKVRQYIYKDSGIKMILNNINQSRESWRTTDV